MSDTSDRIAKILEDPESIRMISEIAESFMSSSESTNDNGRLPDNKTDFENKHDTSNNVYGTLNDLIGKLLSAGEIGNTIRLISALKPYLSKPRRDSADSVLKTLSVLNTLGNSNVAEMLKLFGLSDLNTKG